jgi:hypothetical protein
VSEPARAMDNISIRKRADRAQKEINDLDAGRKRWTMSIPHDFSYDSDHILGVALDDIDYLLAENAARLARIAELEQENASLRAADSIVNSVREEE